MASPSLVVRKLRPQQATQLLARPVKVRFGG
jgi:hypothetical protein